MLELEDGISTSLPAFAFGFASLSDFLKSSLKKQKESQIKFKQLTTTYYKTSPSVSELVGDRTTYAAGTSPASASGYLHSRNDLTEQPSALQTNAIPSRKNQQNSNSRSAPTQSIAEKINNAEQNQARP